MLAHTYFLRCSVWLCIQLFVHTPRIKNAIFHIPRTSALSQTRTLPKGLCFPTCLRKYQKKEENSGIIYLLPTTKSTAIFKGAPPLSGAVRDLWYESNIFRVDNKEKEG